MFEWLKRLGGDASRLEPILDRFHQMLIDGRHMFDLAANALLGGTDTDVIREDLFKTDARINKNEQKLRRRLIVHASVYGAAEFPTCLVLMSIAKDAERIGDYCKNLFDLAASRRIPPESSHHADLVQTKDKLSRQLANTIKVHTAQDQPGARDIIQSAESLQDFCDERIQAIISDGAEGAEGVVSALAFRYLKRIAAHSRNIISSIVMPVDMLDFVDED